MIFLKLFAMMIGYLLLFFSGGCIFYSIMLGFYADRPWLFLIGNLILLALGMIGWLLISWGEKPRQVDKNAYSGGKPQNDRNGDGKHGPWG